MTSLVERNHKHFLVQRSRLVGTRIAATFMTITDNPYLKSHFSLNESDHVALSLAIHSFFRILQETVVNI